jgi:hypothetical protein
VTRNAVDKISRAAKFSFARFERSIRPHGVTVMSDRSTSRSKRLQERFFRACAAGEPPDALSRFLDEGADVNGVLSPQDGFTALHVAVLKVLMCFLVVFFGFR